MFFSKLFALTYGIDIVVVGNAMGPTGMAEIASALTKSTKLQQLGLSGTLPSSMSVLHILSRCDGHCSVDTLACLLYHWILH